MDKTRKNPKPARDDKMPPAGPHAKPELTDYEKTPGSGMLPGPDQDDDTMQPSS